MVVFIIVFDYWVNVSELLSWLLFELLMRSLSCVRSFLFRMMRLLERLLVCVWSLILCVLFVIMFVILWILWVMLLVERLCKWLLLCVFSDDIIDNFYSV